MDSNNAILFTFTLVFVVLGLALPTINQEFYGQSNTIDFDGFTDDLGQQEITLGTNIGSMFSMFFWTFGALPVWLDALFLVMRIIFYVILWDKIRGI